MQPISIQALKFRIGAVEDARRVCVLGAQVFLDAYAASGISHSAAEEVLEYFTVEQMKKELSYASGTFILVESKNNLIGFAQLDCASPQPLASSRATVELHRLYIHPKFTGMGIGKALLAKADTWALEHSAKSVWVTVWAESTLALAFFIQQGYIDVGAGVYFAGTQEYENRILVRAARSEA